MKDNRILSSLIAISLVVTALFAAPASGVWQDDGYPVCTAVNCQGNARLIPDGMGGAFVCWDDKRGGLTEDLYVQHLNADGDACWQSQGVSFCTAANSQYWPRITQDGTGGVIVVWQDLRVGTHTNLYARRIDASGAPVWAANGVAICTSADEQQYARIISDGAGGAIITWQDCRTGIDNDIYAQRINASGSVRWTGGGTQICQVTYSEQEKPGMVPDGLGGAIIIWQDMRNGAYDVYAQRIDASGAVLWALNGVPICSAANDQINVRAVPDGAGGAIVAWEDWRSGAAELFVQHVNILGNTTWTADGVQASSSAAAKTWADLAPDGIGGAILVWQENAGGGDHNIVAQRLNASGGLQWSEDGVDVCANSAYQHSPRVVSDETGGAIVVWEDRRSEFAGDIYAQRVNAAGDVLWTPDGIAVCALPGGQTSAELVSDGLGGGIITWTDACYYTNTDVYAQRIDGSGHLIGIGGGAPKPPVSTLEQNFPNPFNPATVIRFALAEPGRVRLVVYDVAGRAVKVLLDETRDADVYEAGWDGTDNNGAAVPSGVYLYSLETPGYGQSKKMVLLR
jgi:hypothetical protein